MAFVYKVKKGDTLNKIAQQHGFSNYKQAGISSVPSGNFDLIREGESISLGNYDPNKVQGIKTGSPVVSSQDNAQGFKNNSNELDRMLGGLAAQTGTEKKKVEEKTEFGFDEKTGNITKTGDPVMDKMNAWESTQKKQFEREAKQREKEYEKLFQTNLSSIDATASATVQRINASYAKRIQEQGRINDLNIARVKAYGLGNGGQYTPISYGDAVTNREQEASDRITALEGERNSLIAQAEAARMAGKSKLLADKMTAVFDINKALRESLEKVEKEAEAQYKLLRELRQEEEAKHKAAVEDMTKRLTALAPMYLDEYEEMDEAGRDALISKIAAQTGVDYATVYGIMQGAAATAAETEFKNKKNALDLKGAEALIEQRKAGAVSSYASANAANALAEQRRREGSNNEWDKEIPDKFASETEFNQKRQAFVKKHGVKGADYWDDVFNKDDVGDYTYEVGEGGGDLRSRVEAAGYDYDRLKADGHSDEEIEEALNGQ